MWIILFILLIILCIRFLLYRPNKNHDSKSPKSKIVKTNFDEQKLISEINKTIIDSGLFETEALSWIPKIIASNFRNSSKMIDLAIRKNGDLLSRDEKRQYEIRTNAIVSKQYFMSLTVEGKKDPIRSAITVVRKLRHELAILRIIKKNSG